MHYCRLCQFRSKYKWVVDRHAKSKHKENNKRVFLCGNCELITTSVDEMINHKKNEHNIIWNDGNAEKGKGGGKGEGVRDKVGEGEVREDGEDVKKKRSWNHPNFKERGYDSYF